MLEGVTKLIQIKAPTPTMAGFIEFLFNVSRVLWIILSIVTQIISAF